MGKMYWRISYNRIGISEALKKEIWNKSHVPKIEWDNLKSSNAFTWLKTPDFYSATCYSYFTEMGYELFMKKTYPAIIKYLEEKNIDIEKFIFKDDEIKIVYSDEHQIVVER